MGRKIIRRKREKRKKSYMNSLPTFLTFNFEKWVLQLFQEAIWLPKKFDEKKKERKKYKKDKFIIRKNFLEISSLYLRKMEKKMLNLLFLVFFFFQHPNMIKYFCPSPFFSASKHAKIIFLKTLFPCPFYFLEIKHRYLNLLLCYLFSYRLVFL